MNSQRVVNGDWSESYSDAASLSTKTQNLCHCDHLICEPHEYHAVWSRCEEKWLGAFLRPSWVTCLETVTLYNSNCTLSLLLVFGLHKEIGVNQWAYPASCLHAKLGWLHPALVFPWTVRALLWHCNSSSSYSKLKKKTNCFYNEDFLFTLFFFLLWWLTCQTDTCCQFCLTWRYLFSIKPAITTPPAIRIQAEGLLSTFSEHDDESRRVRDAGFLTDRGWNRYKCTAASVCCTLQQRAWLVFPTRKSKVMFVTMPPPVLPPPTLTASSWNAKQVLKLIEHHRPMKHSS